MGNTRLEKLFKQYNFSLKDRHDFMQIFSLLPNYKKIHVVENFHEIAEKMEFLREELRMQQEILFGEAIENIESKLEDIGKSQVVSRTKNEISDLKSII